MLVNSDDLPVFNSATSIDIKLSIRIRFETLARIMRNSSTALTIDDSLFRSPSN